MNYGGIKNLFVTILNRRDVTPSQIDGFMTLASSRIDREIRTPAMEYLVEQVVGVTPDVPVPGDLLEIISVALQDETPGGNGTIVKTSLANLLRYQGVPGRPAFYTRQLGILKFGPEPGPNTVISINYYRSANSLTSDTDTNWVSMACPDLLVYGMLSYAGDFFIDDRTATFESRYSSIANSLNDMAGIDELNNASISPLSYLDDGYDGDN